MVMSTNMIAMTNQAIIIDPLESLSQLKVDIYITAHKISATLFALAYKRNIIEVASIAHVRAHQSQRNPLLFLMHQNAAAHFERLRAPPPNRSDIQGHYYLALAQSLVQKNRPLFLFPAR